MSEEYCRTGVISINKLDIDVLMLEVDNGIDIHLEEYIKELNKELNQRLITEDDYEENLAYYEDDQPVYLIGGWYKSINDNYLYYPRTQYAAIVSFDRGVVQVVQSKYIKTGCALCSPCYPNQIDLESIGKYSGFNLPSEFYNEEL